MDVSERIGIGGMIKIFTIKSLKDDLIYPAFGGLIVILALIFLDKDMLEFIRLILSVYIAVLPTMLGLIIAAYTILISFFWSDKAKAIKNYSTKANPEYGKNTLNSISASFIICILSTGLCLLGTFICHIFTSMSIELTSYFTADLINGITIYFLITLFLFIFKILYDAILDIYDISVISIFIEDSDNKNNANR